MAFDPVLLKKNDGTMVQGAGDWEARRAELLDVLAREEYGFMPDAAAVECETLSKNNAHYGGHGLEEKMALTIHAPLGDFCLPFSLIKPDLPGRLPLFLFLSFEKEPYQKYFPLQEVLSRGYAVALIHYESVTSDDGDMQNGLGAVMPRPADGTGWGKLTLWAWAASRVLDALLLRQDVDANNIAVIGHSRLGKTALWCGANDPRIRFVCVNDSGSSGAAYARGKDPRGENVRIITHHFPFWFCENYAAYVDRENDMPFDQHYAVAACCPRYVAVSSASEDYWAGPESEKKSCEEASEAWEKCGLKGFDRGPDARVSYNLRDGIHFLSLEDWRFYMNFIDERRA